MEVSQNVGQVQLIDLFSLEERLLPQNFVLLTISVFWNILYFCFEFGYYVEYFENRATYIFLYN